MAWDQDLQDASFGGVPLEVVAVTDIYGRRMQVNEYVYRDGAELEDLGREARPTQMEVVFYGAEHLSALGQLQLLFETGKPQTFEHPLLGSWQARIERMIVRHSHVPREHSSVQLELRETGLDTDLPDLFSVDAAKAELESDITVTQDEMDTLFSEEPTEATTAIEDATALIDDVDETLGELETRLDQANKAVLDAVAKAEEYGDVASYPVVRRLRGLSLRSKQLKESVERIQPRVYEQEITADVPLSVLALRLYGDADRGDELVRINRLRNPFIVPAGTTLKLYDR